MKLELAIVLVVLGTADASAGKKLPKKKHHDKASPVVIYDTWVSRVDNCGTVGGVLMCPAPTAGMEIGSCPHGGNLSNNPRISFDRAPSGSDLAECRGADGAGPNPSFEYGSTYHNYCNQQLALCANVASFGMKQPVSLASLEFEVFPISRDGAARGVRRFSVKAPGEFSPGAGVLPSASQCAVAGFSQQSDGSCGYCVLWNGKGLRGGVKDGKYGFRVEAGMAWRSPGGEAAREPVNGSYPVDHTRDCACNLTPGRAAGGYTHDRKPGVTGDGELDSYRNDCSAAPSVERGPTDVPRLPGLVPQEAISVDVGGHRRGASPKRGIPR